MNMFTNIIWETLRVHALRLRFLCVFYLLIIIIFTFVVTDVVNLINHLSNQIRYYLARRQCSVLNYDN